MKINKRVTVILIAFLVYSCISVKKNAITQIERDLSIIRDSQKGIVGNYEKCLQVVSRRTEDTDGNQRAFCDPTINQENDLERLKLIKTNYLINKGYVISIDAKNHHRIFYQ